MEKRSNPFTKPTDPRFVDLTGQRFAELVVLNWAGRTPRGRDSFWRCRCDCGNEKDIRGISLRHGQTLSCGCRLIRTNVARMTKHGGKGTPVYEVWKAIRQRCRNPKNRNFVNYGGRGISLCDKWDDFAAFRDDMGPRPTDRHTVERVDNDGPYAPHNCVWATYSEQAFNRRPKAR